MGEADVAGWTEVDLDVEEPPAAVGDILRLGLEAEVLGPARTPRRGGQERHRAGPAVRVSAAVAERA
ncbi:hypothetical protein [Streptomyces huasconensis]|uniref:hypothetical protein n=1 Tax=Streptomyces huasconensis TaxID=1854574 RepID=UPI0033C8D9A2